MVWSGLVWSGLVWSGLVWSGLVSIAPVLNPVKLEKKKAGRRKTTGLCNQTNSAFIRYRHAVKGG